MNSEAASKIEQKFWQKIFSVTIDRDQITQWEKDLDRVIALFNVCLCNLILTLLLNGILSLKQSLAWGLI